MLRNQTPIAKEACAGLNPDRCGSELERYMRGTCTAGRERWDGFAAIHSGYPTSIFHKQGREFITKPSGRQRFIV